MSELSDPPTLLKTEAIQLSLIGMSGAGNRTGPREWKAWDSKFIVVTI